jgi:pyridoxamine 5'-phosphate oxidase
VATADDPIVRFQKIFERARERAQFDATACCLATADAEGRPSARMVLLKAVDASGFVFYTNYGSRKARQLAENGEAALCFYWPELEEQVRAEGHVTRVSEQESDAYFASRGRLSQVGAWASRQSEPLQGRGTLIGRFLALQARFAGRSVPRPEFWGGFRLAPARMEFWSSRPHRLHDRQVYELRGASWEKTGLYP